MLHRSFKPSKCKTSLKLATSRIKLMKNKKGVQINQMKRELSQLLETGQDRTARIRVEHVIREEKMVAAYDLIEIYCELIAARLPIIESQKNCPIDLKEAVTSVIFASPRCADIPELQDVRKHFTTKYGKEFISAAIELRPDCGVGRMLIEKLSAVAPDVQTKTKVLNAIAEEYNIKWDPKAFEEKESKPPDDLLNGPNTFEKASMMHADPPKFQAAPSVQVPYSHEQELNDSVNYSQQNSRSSLGTRNYASTDTGDIQTSSAASLANARPSARGGQRTEVRQSFPRDGNDSSYGRQNWNMEFKDATAAAQAAAESAERASMAARAAAELSRQGKNNGQYSTDSRNSNFREEGPGRYGASDFPDEHFSRGSVNSSFSDRNPKRQDQQIDRDEYAPTETAAERFYEDGNGRRSSRAASLRSRKDSVDDDNVNAVNTVRKVYGYSQQSSFQGNSAKAEKGTFSPEMSILEQTRTESKVELDNRQQDSFKSDNYGYNGEEMNRNRSSTSSSRSHSINSNDEYNVPKSDRLKFGNDSVEGPSVGVDHRSIYRETPKTSMYDDVTDEIAFDEAESDDDGPNFDTGPQFDEVDVKSFFPSPGRESPIHSLEHTNTWSPKTIMSESVEKSGFQGQIFSERQSLSEHSEHSAKSLIPSEPDPVPAAFDLSDGPDFDNEDEPDRTLQSRSSSVDLNLNKMNEPGARSDLGSPKSGKSRFELTDLLETVSSLHSPVEEEKAPQSQPSSKLSLRDEFQDDVQVPQSSDSESGQELNLGTLPGGFRNKGYRHPPYTRNPSGNASSLSKKSIDQGSSNLEPTPTPIVMSSFNSIASRAERKESSVSHPSSGSDFNYSSLKVTEEENRKSRFEPPAGFLNHDDSDSEDDIPKENSTSRVRLATGLSRRTKAAPSSSETSSFSRVRVEPDARPVNSASEAGRKPTRHSSSDEAGPEPRSHSSSFKQEMSKPMPDSKISRHEESLKSQAAEQPSRGQSYAGPRSYSASSRQEAPRAKPESKSSKREESLKSQAAEHPSSPQRNTLEPSNSSGEKSSTGENSVKKASHVHPKLPDYDDIAARLQALRMNR